MFESLNIVSPKRSSKSQTGWEGFFPYYAGYPEKFARAVLASAELPPDAVIFDPWNGSGTTTYSAAIEGFASFGFDLNPAMVIVARARLLPPSEADSIEPLAREVAESAMQDREPLSKEEPLVAWFSDKTATHIRAIERTIRRRLVGTMTITPTGPRLENISGLAATFYIALFTACRELAAPFRSSNPTWFRKPRADEKKVGLPRREFTRKFIANLNSMRRALADRNEVLPIEQVASEIRLADTTILAPPPESVDLILTSPPYCTRIDYTSATRVELALLNPLIQASSEDLSRQMMGSIRVPDHEIGVSQVWGKRCASFLAALRRHPSKASSGYYYRTHLDYFDKLARSMENLSVGLKPSGKAILVVQGSYYKDICNDLPAYVEDIGQAYGLKLRRREDFWMSRSMAGINLHTRTYKRSPGALEAVLCFTKD